MRAHSACPIATAHAKMHVNASQKGAIMCVKKDTPDYKDEGTWAVKFK